jgi:Txe/YoeB family toxin of Txe-Axe toxin-antitoxin module
MLSFKEYEEILQEASYAGNIGIMELVKFYKQADPKTIAKVKDLIASKKNKEAWDIIQKVTGVTLHKSAFA